MSNDGPESLSNRETPAELVRIDPQGVVSPVGLVAGQRLRAREGSYRILPAPGHVVFLRLTGEDGRRDQEDGAIVRMAGEITAPGTLCDVIALIGQASWRGELVVLDGQSSRSIFFEQGNLVGAQTSVDDERIGMILWRFGVIDEEQHGKIMEKVAEGQRFGQAGVDLGFFTREKLFEFIAKQLEEIVFPTFAIADGTFFFLDGFDDARLVARHTVSATSLLMDGVTRLDELRYFRQKIPSADFVPVRTEKGEPSSEDLKTTWAAIDGELSIDEVGRKTGRGEFDTTKDIYQLIQTKYVVMHPPRMAGGAAAVVARANAALVLLHQRVDAAGKGTALRDSVRDYVEKHDGYVALLQGAGPDERGSYYIDVVAANAGTQVGEDGDAESFLKKKLHEFVGFALFSAGGLLGADKESELGGEVRPMLQEIMPTG